MPKYYVNDNAQPTGEHEVHKEGCKYLKEIISKTDLGNHYTCKEAITAAKKKYSNVDGCYYCCNDCHKK